MELIDRKALLKAIYEDKDCEPTIKFIRDAPTIDAVEVVHGEWIDEPLASTSGGVYWTHRCSVCERQQPYEVFKYCPYCGARMNHKRVQYGERKDEPQTEYEEYLERIRPHDPHKDWFEDEPRKCAVCKKIYPECDDCQWNQEKRSE